MLFNPYAIALLITAVISASVALYALLRRVTPGSQMLGIVMSGVTVYSFGYGMELASSSLAQMLFWNRVQYLAIPFIPVCWLLFALAYTGNRLWGRPGPLLALFAVPVAVLVFVYTNPWHKLYYSSETIVYQGLHPLMALGRGPLYWLQISYAYAMLVWGMVLLIARWFHSGLVYRRQAGVLLVGVAAPWLANILCIAGPDAVQPIDFTPFGFAISGLALAYGLLRCQLLDLVPVARTAVLEAMRDGVLVADLDGRVVDINAACRLWLGMTSAQAIGRPVSEVLSGAPELQGVWAGGVDQEVALRPSNDTLRWADVQLSALTDPQGHAIGKLMLLRDTTSRKQSEVALQDQQLRERELDSIRTAAGTLAHEVNNPLTGVIGSLELMLEDAEEDSPQWQEIRETLDAAQRIRHTMARMEQLTVAEYRPYLRDRQIIELGE